MSIENQVLLGKGREASIGAVCHPSEALHILTVDGETVVAGVGLLLKEGDDFVEFFLAGSELKRIGDEDCRAVGM